MARYRTDPALLMSDAGMAPDAWQADLLRSEYSETLLLAGRQVGKSKLASAIALREALFRPSALVLLLSPTLRQSGELFRDKLLPLWRALGSPEKAGEPTRLELELANGSRIVSLPNTESGIRSYSSVGLLILDEASRIPDALYKAVRPMLAMTKGSLLALSTPFGRRGWFFEAWENEPGWHKVSIRADECPRYDSEFLASELVRLGKRWYAQEYECVFNDSIGQVFAGSAIEAAFAGADEDVGDLESLLGP